MESQELNDKERFEGFAVGKHKVRDRNYSMSYFVRRVANETGYAQKDIRIVLDCLQNIFEDCLVDVSENNNVLYAFGPFEFYSKLINKTGDWTNPRTGEVVHHVPHLKPYVRIRFRYRKAFSMAEKIRREGNGVDIDGTPINK